MAGNSGISAGGGAQVWGNAVASGPDSKAEVRIKGPVEAGARQPTPQEIRGMLADLSAELRRSDHPDRDELIEDIEAADSELAAEQPRLGKVGRLMAGVRSALDGVTALATLAATIERAVHGL
ncbi:hypothetical protein [Streptacidiphilus melanogenes]|uniref:hypothetical protein n=1 Tax=Streptacidiphilus melanogenes TaxID=411235 RepID=UPI0005A7729D|nr:hypothetical protein [Streptacidiphilus melanogenes]